MSVYDVARHSLLLALQSATRGVLSFVHLHVGRGSVLPPYTSKHYFVPVSFVDAHVPVFGGFGAAALFVASLPDESIAAGMARVDVTPGSSPGMAGVPSLPENPQQYISKPGRGR